MNFKTKVLSVLLVVAVLFSSATTIIAEEKAAITVSDKNKEAIETLSKCGIIDKENLNVSSGITRAEFALMVTRMLGVKDVAVCDTRFDDVKEDNLYSGAIKFVSDMGLMSGVGNNLFAPDNVLLREQAAKIIVSLLGYGVKAEAGGGYPAGYLIIANSNGIFNNAGNLEAEECLWVDAIQMLFNALDVDIFQQTKYPEASYKTVDGENILTKYLKLEKIEAVVTANDVTSIKSPSGVKENHVELDGRLYSEGTTNIGDYIGYKVTAYCGEGAASDIKEIVSYSIDKNTKELSFSSDEIISDSCSASVIAYCTNSNNSIKYVSVASDAVLIYNGKSAPLSDVDIASADSLRLVDTDCDSKFDIVFAEDYEVYVVNSFSPNSGIVKDKYSDKTIKLNSDSDVLVDIYKEGYKQTADIIKKNNVLSVAKSRDGSYIKVIVSGGRIKGRVLSISDNEITVADEVHPISDINKEQISKLDVGDYIFLFYTYDEYAAGFEYANESDFMYAYVFDGAVNKKGIDSDKVAEFRFYIPEFECCKTYKTSTNLKVDGERKASGGNDLNGQYLINRYFFKYNQDYGQRMFNPQLLKIKLNDKDEITEIVTAFDNRTQAGGTGEGYDGFSIDYSFHTGTRDAAYNMDYYDLGANGYRIINYKSFGIINSKYSTVGTQVIVIPSHASFLEYYNGIQPISSIEKQFKNENLESWANDYAIYNVDMYDVGEDRNVTFMVTYPYDAASSVGGIATATNEEFFLVDSIVYALDDDMPVKRLKGLYKGENVSYVIDEDAAAFEKYASAKPFDLKRGDVVRISLNNALEVTNIIKIFTLDGKSERAGTFILNGDVYDDRETKTDPQNFGTDQGYPSVNPDSPGETSYLPKGDTRITWVSYHRAVHCKYTYLNGNVAVVSLGERENGKRQDKRMVSMRNQFIYVYDEKTNTVRLGSLDDIDVNDDLQTCVIRMRHSLAETIIINRDRSRGTIYWDGGYDY